jgi:4-amino-4-deoxy-L-arabinose transferase-like glycosyltransferase
MSRSVPSNSERRRWEWLVVPAIVGALAIVFSWQRWISPFIDGGRELAVPARLAAGGRLYRDVMYHYGPLGPWVNAGALTIFGRQFVVLQAVGLLLATLLLVSLYRLTARAGSPLSAGLATTLAAAICLGAPNAASFIFPYSFDALFALSGAFLCLAAVANGGPAWMAAAGLGAALAAKPETGVAVAVLLVVLFLRGKRASSERRRVIWILALGTGASAMAWAIAVFGLSLDMLYPEGPLALFSPPAEWRNLYAVVSGLADPVGSLTSVATALFLDLVILLGAGAVAAVSSRGASARRLAEGLWIGAVLALAVFLAIPPGAAIEDRLPPLLSPMPLAAAAAALSLLRSPLDRTVAARFLLFGFSALMGSRVVVGLAYGAVTIPYSIIAVPGLAASAAVLVLDLLPKRLTHPGVFRRAVAAVFLALSALALARLARFYPPERARTIVTAAGSLRLSTEKALALEQALEYVRTQARPGDLLAGFPEAGLFHFATGIPNPLREDQILPGVLDAEAEAKVSRRLEETRPRFVLLVNQPSAAFGQAAFGRDYAVDLWGTVERLYRLVAVFGDAPPDAPVGSPRFFIRVYEGRRPT